MLKLSLPKGKVVWALAHPVSREYIHNQSGIGYQDCRLIITELDQPKEIVLKDYPKWAQRMIVTSVHRGDLINTGSSVNTPTKETVKDVIVEKPKAKAKKRTQRSKKKAG